MDELDSNLKAWAKRLRKRLKSNVSEFEIKDSGELKRTIRVKLKRFHGQIDSVEIKYIYYGMFIRLGVGRGQQLGQQGARKPKDFVNASLDLDGLMEELAAILARHQADFVLKRIDFNNTKEVSVKTLQGG